ncbi:MAG: BatA and WFA domain-containing protein [Spirochaetales bacterium]|nr:BatA and WFA domain-containing protein [Spirochaetales bacterium]
MEFTNLLPFYILFTIPILILLAFTGKKRYSLPSTTLFLWNTLLTSKRKSITMQRFIKTLCLFLQILIIICIAFALAQPYIPGTIGTINQNIILILDISASMKVPFQENSRFYEAQRIAYNTVSLLEKNKSINLAIIEAGSSPRLTIPYTKDPGVLKKGILQSRPTDEPGHMEKALDMALSLLQGKTGDKIILISDGAFTLSKNYEDKPIHPVIIGDQKRNIAIKKFQIRPQSGKDNVYEGIITIKNYSTTLEKTTLAVTAATPAGETKVLEENCEVGPFNEKSYSFTYTGKTKTIIKADIDSVDDLPADNSARIIIPAPDRIKVLLVSKGNFFLESAFRSFPDISLTKVETISYDDLTALSKSYDILVFDRITPPGIVTGNYILIQSFPRNLPVTNPETIKTTSVLQWDHQHPVMDSVYPGNIRIINASKVIPGKEMKPLIQGQHSPLVSVFSGESVRAVCFFFDFMQSDLILTPSFPILIHNSVRWLFRGKTAVPLQAGEAGETYEVMINPWIYDLDITTPAGRKTKYENINHPFIFRDTQTVGIYTIEGEHYTHQFAVNLTDDDESNINKRFQWTGPETEENTPAVQGMTENYPFRPYFILISVFLLLAEWILWLILRIN